MNNFIIKNYNSKTKELQKKIKKCLQDADFQFILPKLNEKSFLISFEKDNQIISFIQYMILNSKDIFINGAFTQKSYRPQGFSSVLHKKIIGSYNCNFYACALTCEYKLLSSKIKEIRLEK